MTNAVSELLGLALELSAEERRQLIDELVATTRSGVIPADLYETAPPVDVAGQTLRQLLSEERDED